MTVRTAPANDRHTLYRWTDKQNQEWACCAYDHGPMCRRCQPVNDETMRLLLDAVEDRLAEVRDTDEGFSFKLTDKGSALVKFPILKERLVDRRAERKSARRRAAQIGGPAARKQRRGRD